MGKVANSPCCLRLLIKIHKVLGKGKEAEEEGEQEEEENGRKEEVEEEKEESNNNHLYTVPHYYINYWVKGRR